MGTPPPFADRDPTEEVVIRAKRREDRVFGQKLRQVDDALCATPPSDDEAPIRAGTNSADPPRLRFHPSSPSIEPASFGTEQLDAFLRPSDRLGGSVRVASPRLKGIHGDDGPKSPAFDVEMRGK
jgi:hypothetical protein